jgi:2-oxoglutarate ferredoxin oxidoreductase subunit beta
MSCCDKKQSQVIRELSAKKNEYMKFEGSEKLTWCSGCGDFGIQKALERALVLENIAARDVALAFDIGCHGNGSDKINCNTIHGLHGRVVSLAAGISIANPKLKVIAEGGDGGTFSEGPNHLLHAVRNNYNMVFILHNNENYGLTIGQASSMTRRGQPMAGSPDGVTAEPMNACQFVLGLNPSFVARTFSGDVEHMTEVLRAAIKHDGFAFVEVMQLCPTFNKATSQTWFQDRIKKIEKPCADIWDAKKVAQDLEKEIAMGILYEDKNQKSFLHRLANRQGHEKPLTEEVKSMNIDTLIKQFE